MESDPGRGSSNAVQVEAVWQRVEGGQEGEQQDLLEEAYEPE